MNQQERKQKIEDYGRGFEELRAAVTKLPREAWGFRPAPDEWSVLEVLGHMVDSEMLGVTRLYMLVAQPGSTIMPYDDALWAKALRYQDIDAEEALEQFRLLRNRAYQVLQGLPESAFANVVNHPENPHPEFGDVFDVDKWLHIYAWHVADHTGQIDQILDAWHKRARALY